MLGKLMALDGRNYRAQLKLLTPIYFLLVASAFLLKSLNIPALGPFAYGLAIVATVLLIPGAIIMSMIHYYRHLYSNQGYLTHTLPVTSEARYHAKLYSGFLLYVTATVYVLIGGFLLVLANGLSNGLGFLQVRIFWQSIAAFPDVIGLSPFVAWLSVFLIWLFIYLYAFAAYSVSISLGMSRRLSRFGLGGPVIAYIAYYLFNQIVGLVSFLFVPLALRLTLSETGVSWSVVNVMPFDSYRNVASIADNLSTEETIRRLGGHVDFGLGIVVFMLLMMVASYIVTNRQLKQVNLR